MASATGEAGYVAKALSQVKPAPAKLRKDSDAPPSPDTAFAVQSLHRTHDEQEKDDEREKAIVDDNLDNKERKVKKSTLEDGDMSVEVGATDSPQADEENQVYGGEYVDPKEDVYVSEVLQHVGSKSKTKGKKDSRNLDAGPVTEHRAYNAAFPAKL